MINDFIYMIGTIYMFNLYYLEFTKGIPWWSDFLEIFTEEGVLSQSLIDDTDISSDKLRNEYFMGHKQKK